MRQLRIVMLTTFYPPYSFGGDAIGVERLASAIAARGHDVTVVHDVDSFTTLSKTRPGSAQLSESVRVIGLSSKIGMLSNLLTHQLGRPVVHRARLREILKPGAFDIVWFHNISLVGGPGLLEFGDGLKIYEAHEHWLVCPTHVLWRHNRELCDGRECLRCVLSYRRPPQIWRSLNTWQRQLDLVDAYIAKSEFSRQKHKEFGFDRKMEIVPYFLPERVTLSPSNGQLVQERPYFLFVGRLEKIKGLDEVISAFRKYQDADLLIVGTGEYEEELRRQATGLGNIKFIGRLAPHELSRYYQSAIALIVPSVCFETFGIVLIESFREGTPVIARALGPFVEIVNKCSGGMLFSDSDGLVQAMGRLQKDAELRASMAEAAELGFKTFWSEKAVLSEYFKTLQQAALAKGDRQLAHDLGESA